MTKLSGSYVVVIPGDNGQGMRYMTPKGGPYTELVDSCVLDRLDALMSLKNHSDKGAQIAHLVVGPVLTDEELRKLKREQMIEDRGLTPEDVELLENP